MQMMRFFYPPCIMKKLLKIFKHSFLPFLKKIVGYYCVEVWPDKKYLWGAKRGRSEKPPKMKKNDFFYLKNY